MYALNRCLVLLFASLLLAQGCKKDKPRPDGPQDPDVEIPKLPIGPVLTSVFGMVVNEKDEPMAGVEIKGGNVRTTTDANGIYTLSDVTLDGDRGYITADKAGYFKGSRIFKPLKDDMSQLAVIKLLPKKIIGKVDAAAGGSAGSDAGIKITLPAAAVEGYNGQIQVAAVYMNPTRPDFFAMMPGDLGAVNAENKQGRLWSFGMSHIELLDDAGNILQLKEGKEATVSLPVPPRLVSSSPATVPMWYFDETAGIWKEEGSGTLQNGKYAGKVKHFSTWNFDVWRRDRDLWTRLEITYDRTYPDLETAPVPLGIRNRRLRAMLTVRADNGQHLNSTVVFLPPPATGSTQSQLEVPIPIPDDHLNDQNQDASTTLHTDVTILPDLPGPDYPTAKPSGGDYSPTPGEDQVTPPPSQDDTPTPIGTETTMYPLTGAGSKPEDPVIIGIGMGGGSGYIVNVNGKAVDCDGQPLKDGYATISLFHNNTFVRSSSSAIYSGGLFVVESWFGEPLHESNAITQVKVTVYDRKTGLHSVETAYPVNPSLALSIPGDVRVCSEPGSDSPDKVYEGSYYIDSESKLQAFIQEGYNEVTGILEFRNVSNLDGIVSLKRVGTLNMIGTTAATLGGLAQLESMQALRVEGNGALVGLYFPKLSNRSMAGGLYISNNGSLVDISIPSVESMASNGQFIAIVNNPFLSTLLFPQLRSLQNCGQIEIRANKALSNLNAFGNVSGSLAESGGGLILQDNASLGSVSGLSGMVINNRVRIQGNPKLSSLAGINVPAELKGNLEIVNNEALSDISAVTNRLIRAASVAVNGNGQLPSIDFSQLVQTTALELLDNNAVTSIRCPKLSSLQNLALQGTAVTTIDFSALSSITGAQGQLWLRLPKLTTVDFPSLKTCDGRLLLEGCYALTNLDGFNKLEVVGGYLDVVNSITAANPISNLVRINGFNALTRIGGNFRVLASADYKGVFSAIKGFQKLTEVGGNVTLSNQALSDVSGLANLVKIRGELNISYSGLANLGVFKKLANVQGLNLNNNGKLNTIGTLPALKTLSTYLNIDHNPLLANLSGLEALTSITDGYLSILNNEALANLDGLKNLASIKGNLTVTGNKKLGSFCGLNKLVTSNGIGGSYTVNANDYNPTAQDIKEGRCGR